MLVLLSDLHLTDGTSCPTLHPGAIHQLAHQLRDLAARASWRADGTYHPIESIELVLLGDCLDLSNTERWLRGPERPWGGCEQGSVVGRLSEVTDAILQHNAASLNLLRSLAADPLISVPPADAAGHPAYDAVAIPVAVRTVYMVGNRDWMLHLPGRSYDLIRNKIAHHLGLTNASHEPFPHDPMESPELQEILQRHGVVARHGDIFDPLNYAEDRDMPSMGDLVSIELLVRFVQLAQERLADDLPPAVLAQLTDVHHLRPVTLAPAWLESLLGRGGVPAATRKAIRGVWDEVVEAMLEQPAVDAIDGGSPHQLREGLSRALLFRRGAAADGGAAGWRWAMALRGSDDESLVRHAMSEPEFRNRRARHVVYGHTHRAEHAPLEISDADGIELQQGYFNGGTWRRVFQSAAPGAGTRQWVPCEAMQILAFYQQDERGGRPFEILGGMLGIPSPAGPMRQKASAPASRMRAPGVPRPHLEADPVRQAG